MVGLWSIGSGEGSVQCDFWEVWEKVVCHSGHVVCGHGLPCSARSVMFYHASPELAHWGEIEACFPLLNSLWFLNDFQHPPGSSSNIYLNQTISYLFVVLFLWHQFCSMAPLSAPCAAVPSSCACYRGQGQFRDHRWYCSMRAAGMQESRSRGLWAADLLDN